MNDYSKSDNSSNFNSIFNLNKLYSSSGKNKQAWEDLLISIYQSPSNNDLINYLIQTIKSEPSNILTLDIIDFLVECGPKPIVKEISSIDFLNNVVNLIKKNSGAGIEVTKKCIYLIKKWNEKANELGEENYEGFIHHYIELNKKGISFPPSGYKLFTFELYISEIEANIFKSKAEQSIIQNQNQNFNNNFSNNFSNDNNNINNNYNNINDQNFINKENNYNMDDDIPSNEKSSLDQFYNKDKDRNYLRKDNGFPKIEDDKNKNNEQKQVTPNPFSLNKNEKYNGFPKIEDENNEDQKDKENEQVTPNPYLKKEEQKYNSNKNNDFGGKSGSSKIIIFLILMIIMMMMKMIKLKIECLIQVMKIDKKIIKKILMILGKIVVELLQVMKIL